MYIKIKKRKQKIYLELVESVREGSAVRQIHIASLGNLHSNRENLMRIARSIIKHCGEERFTYENGTLIKASEYGRTLVCEKLFVESGLEYYLDEKIKKIRGKKKYYVSLPHIKAMIFNRLCAPRSKYSILRWLEDVHISGIEIPSEITQDEQKKFAEVFYKNMDFLLPLKEEIENVLYGKVKLLFDEIEALMYDLTSTYFEGKGPKGLSEYGYSRDEKKNNKQIVIAVVMANGFPIAHEIFRGNIRDSQTLKKMVDKLKKKYKIKRVIFVSDAGILSKGNTKYLKKIRYEYIICAKRRRSEKWWDIFKGWEEASKEITTGYENGEKRIRWDERRYKNMRIVLCESPDRLNYEREMRESIMREIRKKLERLEKNVKEGKLKEEKLIIKKAEKILGRKGGEWYFKYKVERGKFEWCENKERIEEEKFIEGKFFLLTNNKSMTAEQLIYAYKDLWKIERGFRTLKDFVRVRPIYHWKPDRVKAHVQICVISLFLEKLLQHKIESAKMRWSARRLLESTRTIKLVKVKTENEIKEKVTHPGSIQQKMLEIVGIKKSDL